MHQTVSSAATAAKTALDATSEQNLRVPCYCEENVWRLAYRKLQERDRNFDSPVDDPTVSTIKDDISYYVVFVTNPKGCVPMFQQLAVNNPLKPCFWDYHVILFACSKLTSETTVLDIDSHLPYSSPLSIYLQHVFPSNDQWPEEYQPYFRVMEAKVYVESFSSDRMHMYNADTNTWHATPPTYPCIGLPNSKSNLGKYMHIDKDEIQSGIGREDDSFGAIYSLPRLRKRFCSGRQSARFPDTITGHIF